MQPHATPIVLKPGEGRTIDLGNFGMSVKGETRIDLGVLRPGRLTLFTRFPVGLFHAWSYVDLDTHCVVYPRPAPAGVDDEAVGQACLLLRRAAEGTAQLLLAEGDRVIRYHLALRDGEGRRGAAGARYCTRCARPAGAAFRRSRALVPCIGRRELRSARAMPSGGAGLALTRGSAAR